MRIKLRVSIFIRGEPHQAGEIIDVADAFAAELIGNHRAVPAGKIAETTMLGTSEMAVVRRGKARPRAAETESDGDGKTDD